MLFSISCVMWQSHLYRIKPITARCYSYHSFKNIKFQHNLAFYWSSKICLHTTSISVTWTQISLKFVLSLKTRRISGYFNAPATYYRLVRFVASALKQSLMCQILKIKTNEFLKVVCLYFRFSVVQCKLITNCSKGRPLKESTSEPSPKSVTRSSVQPSWRTRDWNLFENFELVNKR